MALSGRVATTFTLIELACVIIFLVTSSWSVRAAIGVVFLCIVVFEAWRWFEKRRRLAIDRQIAESRRWENEQLGKTGSRG